MLSKGWQIATGVRNGDETTGLLVSRGANNPNSFLQNRMVHSHYGSITDNHMSTGRFANN